MFTGDDVEVRMRASVMWLFGRMLQSHFPSGENWSCRAPNENAEGAESLEMRRVSFSSEDERGRRRKSLMSVVVETARIFPSALRSADVILASPLIKILATNLRLCAGGSSSLSSEMGGFDDVLRRQIWTSLSHQLIISLFFGALRSIDS